MTLILSKKKLVYAKSNKRIYAFIKLNVSVYHTQKSHARSDLVSTNLNQCITCRTEYDCVNRLIIDHTDATMQTSCCCCSYGMRGL